MLLGKIFSAASGLKKCFRRDGNLIFSSGVLRLPQEEVSKMAFLEAFSAAGLQKEFQKNIFFGYWLLGKKIVNLQPVLK